MGSKNNPGAYDGYAKALPDEPLFVLMGRDPDAPMLVRLWASIRARSGEVPEKVAEALQCANAMDDWREGVRPSDGCDRYRRPAGIMGGPCLNCGRSQPEHAAAPQNFGHPDACARCAHHRKVHEGICAAVINDVICQCDGFVEQEHGAFGDAGVLP